MRTATIPGFSHYIFYEDGRIFSLHKGAFIRTSINKGGYRRTNLTSDDGKTHAGHVARFILMAFKPTDSTGLQAAHNDGNRSNDAIANLRWATCKENQADRVIHGTRSFGERHGAAKLTVMAVRVMRKCFARKITHRFLSKIFRVGPSQIHRIKIGEKWASV